MQYTIYSARVKTGRLCFRRRRTNKEQRLVSCRSFCYTRFKALSPDGRRSATPLRKGVIAIVGKLFRLCVCAAFTLYILTIYAK